MPSNDKLPDGGGGTAQYVAITSAASARGSLSYQTKETDFADARTAYWHGVDVNMTARVADRVNLQAGTSTGRGVRNTCDSVGRPSGTAGEQPGRFVLGHRTVDDVVPRSRLVSRPEGRRADQLDAAVDAHDGRWRQRQQRHFAERQLPAAEQRGGEVSRPPAGRRAVATGTTTVNIVVPSALYPSERRNQIDMRFAKILRFGGGVSTSARTSTTC